MATEQDVKDQVLALATAWIDDFVEEMGLVAPRPVPEPTATRPEDFKVNSLSPEEVLAAVELLTSHTRFTIGHQSFYRIRSCQDPDQAAPFRKRLSELDAHCR